jgi:hypothetical protein
MKKLFAILISLLFVGTTFGIASVMAVCNCGEDNIILPTKVSPGQEFIIKAKNGCPYVAFTADFKPAFGVLYTVSPNPPYPEGDYIVFPSVALKPGTIYFCNGSCPIGVGCMPSNGPSSCFECETLTISTSYYPMQQFMKILGFGQKD